MTERATKLRNRRRKRARQRAKVETIGLSPDRYRLGLLLWMEEINPDMIAPAHRQEIDEFLGVIRDAAVRLGRDPAESTAVETIRVIVRTIVPEMVRAMMEGNPTDYDAYKALDGFDAYKFRDETLRYCEEIAAAGLAPHVEPADILTFPTPASRDPVP